MALFSWIPRIFFSLKFLRAIGFFSGFWVCTYMIKLIVTISSLFPNTDQYKQHGQSFFTEGNKTVLLTQLDFTPDKT